MKNFARRIVGNRKLIFLIWIIIIIASAAGIVGTVLSGKINGDLMAYLGGESETAEGLTFLKDTFNIKGDALIVVSGEKDDPQLSQTVDKIKGTKGISQFIWVGDMESAEVMLRSVDTAVGKAALEKYFGADFELNYDFSKIISYLKQPVNEAEPDGEYSYVMLGMIDYPPSTTEAINLLIEVRETFEAQGRTVVTTGMTSTSDRVMNGILGELPYYLIFALIAVIAILLLTTDSFIDPIVLLLTLGVSIIVSMGTNFFFKDVSIISFALSSILQLAVTMDYAIFFLHIYKQKRAEGFNAESAVAEAAPNVWSSIMASCLTTVGGFAALYCMQFTLGADLGKVLIKAVLVSLVSVIVLQPVLMIALDKVTTKYSHKAFNPSFRGLSNFVVDKRTFFIVLVALLILPAFVLQNTLGYSYFKIYEEPKQPTAQEELASELYNQLMCAVPVIPKEGKDAGDFIAEVESIDNVKLVMSVFSMLDVEPEVVEGLMREYGDDAIVQNFVGSYFGKVSEENGEEKFYTMYTIVIEGADESVESVAIYKKISAVIDEYYDDCYTMGMLTGVSDMMEITPTDFLNVTLVSVAIILAVMMLLLLNIRQSVLVVLLIEFGIWLNIAINVLTGTTVNFMVYIILSSIQLGCTVDYAILMCTRYKEHYVRCLGDKKLAAKRAAASSLFAITTSASIIVSVCLVVMFVTDNMIVKQMTGLLARGGAISYFLVMFVLPGILSMTKPTLIGKTRRDFDAVKRYNRIP